MEILDKFNTAWISVTYNCNNRCKWCYASSNLNEYRKKELDSSNEDGIINLLVNLGIRNVRLIGGEPTIYPNIVNLTEKLTSSGLRASIVTNGRRFSDIEFAKAIKKAGLVYASFSIEGYNKEIHEQGTNVKGSFQETIKGLENALEAGIGTATNTTITKDNLSSLEKIIDLLQGKPELVTFNICSPCLRTDSNASNAITPVEGAKAFENVYVYAKQKSVQTKLVTPTPVCNFKKKILEEMKKDKALSGRCQMVPGNTFVLDYNGDVLPCTHFSGFPFFNIYQNGKIISEGEFVNRFNDPNGLSSMLRTKIRHFPSKKCTEKCDEFCTGGCPLFWTKFNPDEHIKGKNES